VNLIQIAGLKKDKEYADKLWDTVFQEVMSKNINILRISGAIERSNRIDFEILKHKVRV
jgi:hypothetical protein